MLTMSLFPGRMRRLRILELICLLSRKDHPFVIHLGGEEFKVECPVGSGHMLTLDKVASELARRLAAIFLRGEDGRRPVFGSNALFHDDPY